MSAGSFAYSLGKMAACQIFRSSTFRFLPTLLAPVVGLTAEVASFQSTERLFTHFQNGESAAVLFNWSGENGFSEGCKISWVEFAMMKGMGHLLRAHSSFTRHLIQDLSVVAGRQSTAFIGWTPAVEGSFLQQMLHAEIMNLQCGAGNLLAGHISGLRLQQVERFLHQNIEAPHYRFQERPLVSFAHENGPMHAIREAVNYSLDNPWVFPAFLGGALLAGGIFLAISTYLRRRNSPSIEVNFQAPSTPSGKMVLRKPPPAPLPRLPKLKVLGGVAFAAGLLSQKLQTPDHISHYLQGVRELRSYELASERENVRLLLNPEQKLYETLRPRHVVTEGDYTFYLSDPFSSHSRDFIMGLVPIRVSEELADGQQGPEKILLRRVYFYKSRSDGGVGWRACPGSKSIFYKGRHYTAETQANFNLALRLESIRKARPAPFTVNEEIRPYINWSEHNRRFFDFSKEGEEGATIAHWEHQVEREEIDLPYEALAIQKLQQMQPGVAFAEDDGLSSFDERQERLREQIREVLSLNGHYPAGFIPRFEFQENPDAYFDNEFLGRVGVYVSESVLCDTQGGQHPLIWRMFAANDPNDPTGQGKITWCDVRLRDAEINYFGADKRFFDSGLLGSKVIEYWEQCLLLDDEYKQPLRHANNTHYILIHPLLHLLEPIMRFRQAMGWEIAEAGAEISDTVIHPMSFDNAAEVHTGHWFKIADDDAAETKTTTYDPNRGTQVLPESLQEPALAHWSEAMRSLDRLEREAPSREEFIKARRNLELLQNVSEEGGFIFNVTSGGYLEVFRTNLLRLARQEVDQVERYRFYLELLGYFDADVRNMVAPELGDSLYRLRIIEELSADWGHNCDYEAICRVAQRWFSPS